MLTALAVVSIAAGTILGLEQATSGTDWTAGAIDEVRDSSLMVAAQPRPAATARPSKAATASPSPSSPAPKPSPSSRKPSPPYGTVVQQLLAQINQLRARNGLAALSLSAGLIASAHKHNLKMMGSCGMQHQCPGEASLGDRISAEGVHWTSCGENIGWAGPYPNTTAALIGAAESLAMSMYNEKPPNDGHRKNLLSSSFHRIGIDAVRDSSGKIWLTQDFSS